jgi:hypothetical protein
MSKRANSRRVVGACAVVALVCSQAALADLGQNTVVKGTAAGLTAYGFNLNGSGVSIGLLEAGNNVPNVAGLATPGSNLPNGNPDLPAARITLMTPLGGGITVGNHASETAGVIVSANATETGIAPGATLLAAGTSDFNSYATQVQNAVDPNRRNPVSAKIINFSAGIRQGVGLNDGSSTISMFTDWAAKYNDTLFVIAGNETPVGTNDVGSPSDAYNCINVGATGTRTNVASSIDYTNLASYNLSNTTADGRIKTDIVAPGGDPFPLATLRTGPGGTFDPNYLGTLAAAPANGFTDQFHTTAGGQIVSGGSDTYNTKGAAPGFADNTTASAYVQLVNGAGNLTGQIVPTTIAGTSFAAPEVSGAAALLYQYGNAQGLTFSTDHRLMKALLLNGATKTVNGVPLTLADGVTPWTRAPATGADAPAVDGFVAPVQPGLDPNLGTGELNVVNSLVNYAAGRNPGGVGGPRQVNYIGWDVNVATPADTVRYDFSTAASSFTATLCWDDTVTINNTAANGTWQVGSGLARTALANLDLYLFEMDNLGDPIALTAYSTSIVDNVEHIWIPNLDPGSYELDVVDQTAGDPGTPYGLAWATTVPEPTLALVLMLPALAMGRKRR